MHTDGWGRCDPRAQQQQPNPNLQLCAWTACARGRSWRRVDARRSWRRVDVAAKRWRLRCMRGQGRRPMSHQARFTARFTRDWAAL